MKRRIRESFGIGGLSRFFGNNKNQEDEYHYTPHVDPQTAEEDNKEFYNWLNDNFDSRIIKFKKDSVDDIMRSDNTLDVKKKLAMSILGKAETYMRDEKMIDESRLDYIIRRILKEQRETYDDLDFFGEDEDDDDIIFSDELDPREYSDAGGSLDIYGDEDDDDDIVGINDEELDECIKRHLRRI